MKINEVETFARPSFKDVIKYKVVWLFKVIFGAYMKYVELYDFEGLIWGEGTE